MKKSVFFLTLLLCLSLIFPGAHAEDTYVPGERMRSLVSSALEAGQLVGGEAHFSLTLPDSMLPDDEEGRAQFDALAEVIQGVSLAGGMGRRTTVTAELGGTYRAIRRQRHRHRRGQPDRRRPGSGKQPDRGRTPQHPLGNPAGNAGIKRKRN
ncbi:MAG: hypothetical protein ACLVJB_00945 [Christensenellales bacterium]